jgi:adenylate cyclase
MDGPEPAGPPQGAPDANDRWRRILSGSDPTSGLKRLRGIFRHLPSDPRCKLCYAPYAAPFGPLLRRLGFGRWPRNPSLCGSCLRIMEKAQGGAEIELSVLFADLRDSTDTAARMSASEFRALLNAFYAIAAHAVQASDGLIDKYLGDGVLALFIPGFVGHDHAARAIKAASGILAATADASTLPREQRPLRVGIGVHSGTAYVGVIGQAGELTDFTALGDAVNLAARLSSAAAAREVLISDAAVRAAGQDTTHLERRELQLKGVSSATVAWSLSTAGEGAPGHSSVEPHDR